MEPGHSQPPSWADTASRKTPTGKGRVSIELESEAGSSAEVCKGNRGKKLKAGNNKIGQNAPEIKRENCMERRQAPQAEAKGGVGEVGPRRENRGEACGFWPPGQLSRATCRWGLEGSAWGCGWARIPFHVHQHQFRAPGQGPEKHGGLIKPWCLPARSFQAMEKRDVGETGSGVGALVFMGEVATDAWDSETGENTYPSRQGESFVCLFVCVFLLFIGDIFKSLWQ